MQSSRLAFANRILAGLICVYFGLVASQSWGDAMQDSASINENRNHIGIDWNYAKNNRDLLEFCTLVCARDVDTYLATKAQLERAAEGLRDLCVTKVYLETMRSGYRSSDSLLRSAKKFFAEEGFDVGGAITPTAGTDFGTRAAASRTWLCYSSEKTHRDLAEITAYTTSLFDEVIFDDFLCTNCECEICRRLKGDLSWWEFRTKQMTDVSRKFILDPGHAANPNAKIIIKYPQWYDKFHDMGYDARGETDAFDYIWIGTETRDPETPRFGFVEPYQSYFIYRWLGSVAGAKRRGGWFDVYDCHPRVYVYQAYQNVLAGAREVLLFNFSAIVHSEEYATLMSAFKKDLPRYYDLAKRVCGKTPRGIYAYKPVHSDGGSEDFLFDYIGMLGIPLVPCSKFPRDASALLLTAHAASDSDIISKVREHVSSGGSIVATPGFLRQLGTETEITALFGYPEIAPTEETAEVKAFDVGGTTYVSDKAVTIAVLPHPTGTSTKVWALASDEAKVPCVTVKQTDAGGSAVMLNLRTRDTGSSLLMNRPVSFLHLPEAVVNRMREAVLGAVGLSMTAPARVGLYPLGDDLLVLYNYNKRRVSVELKFTRSATPRQLFNPWREERVSPSDQGLFKVQLDAGEIAPLELE